MNRKSKTFETRRNGGSGGKEIGAVIERSGGVLKRWRSSVAMACDGIEPPIRFALSPDLQIATSRETRKKTALP